MLRGDIQVTLLEPSESSTDEFGEEVATVWIEHSIPARRADRRGDESGTEIPAAMQQTIWTVNPLGTPGIDATWRLKDMSGNLHEITAVTQHPSRRMIDIHTTLYTAAA